MAEPLSASKLLKILKAEGLTVHEVRNWRTHNRNAKGNWGPVNGVMIHHTVTKGTSGSVDLCYDGHSALPGPLCHGVIDKKGEIHLVGHGRANHAGSGDPDVLAAVIAERKLPPDNQATVDGNARFYGFECINLGDGKDPWPEAQKEAIEKVSAAICRAHGWSERSVIGHKEWQPGKVDPRGFTMDAMRARIKDRLAGKGGDSKPKPPGRPDHPPKPRYEPFPGAGFFHDGRSHPMITMMGHRLNAEGCGRYEEGPGPEWTEADRKSYQAWQHKLGFKGKDADGVPGKVSWDLLKVPHS
ncbi:MULTISPECIES: peptidoglycan-binding protein [Streptomyces]|uniref:Phage protein n=1 Tax=Streptomyces albus (strain ATCC 21838 / DSM 41398 / FERM P-419 / JCM 4703 / NBRC 107858) TaxID=1081613 RepID=A0A0B5ETR2_STRA4|nr:peptidoglycan-binding protein [Streptomyces sp. SCSIO ZS0520]AJE85084.1 phage protein [Streptomyces albus]AOU79391.1 phage protein [Streptomyces albus]AYN35118.1 N-acetylmuramoyl-L-alanine amidase [Streptomyces albus]